MNYLKGGREHQFCHGECRFRHLISSQVRALLLKLKIPPSPPYLKGGMEYQFCHGERSHLISG